MMALLLTLIIGVDSRLDESLPVFPGSTVIEVGNRVRTPGQEFRFGYSSIKRSGSQIAHYFAKKWTDEGFPTVVERTPDNHLLVAAFDTTRGIQRIVVVAPGDRETIVFTALADLWPNLDRDKVRTRASENRLSLDELTWLDNSVETNQVHSYVEADLDAAREEVTRNLEAAGYVLVRERAIDRRESKELLLEHKKGDLSAMTVLRALSPSLTAVSQTTTGDRYE